MLQLTTQQPELTLPLALALQLLPQPQGLQLKVLKRRAGWAGQQFYLNWQDEWPELYPVLTRTQAALAETA